jgi:hypothetical protein
MSLINEKYDKVVCICLKERDDKYKFALSQFIKHDIQVEWYRPVIHNYIGKLSELYSSKYNNPSQGIILFNSQFPNELNVMQSFYHVVKSALLDGAESLFIFEDDFQMHRDWDALLPKYFEKLPQSTDLIMLYSYQHELFSENIRVSSRWIKAFRSWSNIAVGMNKKYMEEYIKEIDNCPRIGDLVTYQLQEKLNCYIACPVLGIPSKQFISNIRGNNKNYDNPLFQNAYTFGLNENLYT